jgi:hypothetical protein
MNNKDSFNNIFRDIIIFINDSILNLSVGLR